MKLSVKRRSEKDLMLRRAETEPIEDVQVK
jgi:hypothetical protein